MRPISAWERRQRAASHGHATLSVISHLRRHILAYIALFIALSGSALAATKLAKNSVGRNQIRNHAVTYQKLDSTAVSGVLGRIVLAGAVGPDTTVCPLGGGTCEVGASDARCPNGALVTGGGWTSPGTTPPVSATVGYSEQDADGLGWHVIMANDNSGGGFDFEATARCTAYSAAAKDQRAAVRAGVVVARELAAERAATGRR